MEGQARFCRKCGTKLKEGAKFCGACGTAVVQNRAVPAARVVPVTPVAPVDVPAAKVKPSKPKPVAKKKPIPKKMGKGAAVLAVILCIVIFIFSSLTISISGIRRAALSGVATEILEEALDYSQLEKTPAQMAYLTLMLTSLWQIGLRRL